MNLIKLATKSKDESEIAYAECGCPAGKGSEASCVDIAALAYALVDLAIEEVSILHWYRCVTAVEQTSSKTCGNHPSE